jgi:hypothetical protein
MDESSTQASDCSRPVDSHTICQYLIVGVICLILFVNMGGLGVVFLLDLPILGRFLPERFGFRRVVFPVLRDFLMGTSPHNSILVSESKRTKTFASFANRTRANASIRGGRRNGGGGSGTKLKPATVKTVANFTPLPCYSSFLPISSRKGCCDW